MKITRLQKAKGYRIFRDFTWPAAGLPDFARFNVIYGWNGAGKTSLSNIFRHIQRKEALTEGQTEVVVDQTRVPGSNFNTAILPAVRTFNRNTVHRNVFEVPNQHLPPVFFLGEDSVEKQKSIEELKKQHDTLVQSVSNWDRKKADASSALEAFCAEEAKGIKNLLTVPGGGPFNNYNAANFKAAVQGLSANTPLPTPLNEKERQQHLSTRDGRALDKLVEPSASFPDVIGLTKRTQAMLERSIVSAIIGDLKENPSVAAWVNAGLGLHTGSQATGNCRFCDQPLPEHRLKQLEAHFNDEFKRFQVELDFLINEVSTAKDYPKTLHLPPKEALYGHLRSEYEKATGTLSQQTATVQMALDILIRSLQAKRDEPFKRLELAPFITGNDPSDESAGIGENFFRLLFAGVAFWGATAGKTAFDHVKALIERHNQHTASFDTEVQEARKALARDEVLRVYPEWQKKTNAVSSAHDKSKAAREQAEKIKAEIAELELQVKQHQRPAEELNEEIAAYLGRDELRFEVEQNGYRITRGGHPATHLSDGERTAIAFLYFLKSLQGTDFDLKTGVVVIDDPVSSLDANSLFSAFGFMKRQTATAGQLFVLTHNFTFFRQVRNWFYNLPGQQKKDIGKHPARFFMLATEFVAGVRTAKLDILDPFLHQYESEYHYLFKRVYEEAHKPANQGLEAYYAIPNIARRLLEAFLAFRIPEKQGELYQKLEVVPFDVAKKTRILRFLHTYSHFDQIAEAGHDPSVLSETPAILLEVLALIQNCDPAHFMSMTKLVAPPIMDVAEAQAALAEPD